MGAPKGNEYWKLAENAGAPSIYTDELAKEICFLTATSSKSLRTICDSLHIGVRTVLTWRNEKEDFERMYARAKEEQADFMAEEILDIADDASNDTLFTDKGVMENKEWVNRSRLRVDTRKWIASKLKPKKYGDKIEATVNASEGVRMILGNKLPGEDEIKSENE